MPRRNYSKKATQPVRATQVQSDSCASKHRYSSEMTAKTAAETQMLISFNLELRTYQCSNCQGWHLTRLKES